MRVDAFKIADYAEIEMSNGLGLEHWGLKGGIFPTLTMMEKAGTYYTVRDEGKVILIGGYFEFIEGVCEVSFYPSISFVEKPLAGYKLLKPFMEDLKVMFRRVQSHCIADERFIKFAESFGFKQEGILRRFSHSGADHVMMAIVGE